MITTDKLKKYVLPNIPYTIIFWFANKFGEAYRIAPGDDFLKKLTGCIGTINTAFSNILPSFNPQDLLVGIAGVAIIYAVLYYKKKNAKKWRKGEEYGSARWSA